MATTLTVAKARANKKWDSENLERLSVFVRKGEKEQIKAAASGCGESINHYVVSAVMDRMRREGVLTEQEGKDDGET